MMLALVVAAISFINQLTSSHKTVLLSPKISTVTASASVISPAVLAATIQTTTAPTASPMLEVVSTVKPTSQPTLKPTIKAATKPTALPTITPTQSPSPSSSATSSVPATESAMLKSSPPLEPSATPKPEPKIQPISKAEIEKLFVEYADQYKIDKEQLKRISQCESGLNPNATNMYYGGLFQFSPASWKGYRRLMGKRTDPELRFDAEASINTAAFMISTGRTSAWPNCK
ncbi:MAG: transglycosylase family protein [bacterium]|nr:transglycosylase family protein [bacterium]